MVRNVNNYAKASTMIRCVHDDIVRACFDNSSTY